MTSEAHDAIGAPPLRPVGDLARAEHAAARPLPPRRRVERAPTKGASTARHLAQYIIDNAIEPGTTLPPEKALSERFGIGRGTMNDALRLLETYGLLELRPGRYGGPVVRRPDATDLSSSLTLAFYAAGASVLDVMDARLQIEPSLAALAALRITDDELEALRRTVAEIRDPESTEEVGVAASEEFHNIVFEAAQSPVLSLLAASLHRIIASRAIPIQIAEVKMKAVADEHEAIIEALSQHDAERSAELWTEHTRHAEEYYRDEFAHLVNQPIVWTI